MKLTNIIKSKFIKGENLPEWYEKRLEICSNCELNSKNIERKSASVKTWELVAGAYCTICKCTVLDKSKIESENCPINKWSILEQVESNDLYKVTNLSPDKVKMEKQGIFFNFDYGFIAYDSDSKIGLRIDLEGAKDHTVKSSCGCTIPKIDKQGDSIYNMEISYDTKRAGFFKKTATFQYTKNNIKNAINFVITGTVTT